MISISHSFFKPMDPLKGFHVVPLHLIEKRYKINARLDYI